MSIIKDIGHAIEHAAEEAGNDIVKAGKLVPGGDFVEDMLKKGTVGIYNGAVSAVNYVSEHACDIAVGSVLGALFVAGSADGEAETAITPLLLLKGEALGVGAEEAAKIIMKSVNASGIMKGGTEDVATALVAYIIEKAIEENTAEAEATGGEFVYGAIVVALTTLICTGQVPTDFEKVYGK